MANNFMRQAVEAVTRAIEEDNAKNYEAALPLYMKSLDIFMMALKYEKNPAAKELVTQRVSGYMRRAEQLKELVKHNEAAAAARKDSKDKKKKKAEKKGSGDGESEEDDENAKLQGALADSIVAEKPNVKWDDVAGLEGAKAALKEAVILPTRFPSLFQGKRKPWKGILLYGPPGTGKTFLAKAVATEAQSTFFSVSSSSLISKWQGESEKLIRNLFAMARDRKPSIIFIDEVDSLCSSRSEGESDSNRRVKTEFLVQMQGVGNSHDGILVLAATNTPWSIDSAMRRRFEKRVYISLPDAPARAHMFGVHLGDTPHSLTKADFDELGRMTDGYSGSDVSVIVREALMEPLRECQNAEFFRRASDGFLVPCKGSDEGAQKMTLMEVEPSQLRCPDVEKRHFLQVLSKGGGASVSPDELVRYAQWTEEFGQEG
eukprot:g3729.t1